MPNDRFENINIPPNSRMPQTSSEWYNNNVYTGSECIAICVLPDGAPVPFGSLQLLSVSGHRDAGRVLPLGVRSPVGFTFGPDIHAGSLAFTVVREDALDGLFQWYWERQPQTRRLKTAMMLPPFDIVAGLNYGDPDVGSSHNIALRGVSIVDAATSLGVSRPTIGQEYAFVCMESTAVMPNVSSLKTPEKTEYMSPGFEEKSSLGALGLGRGV